MSITKAMDSAVPPDLVEASLEEILERAEPKLRRVLGRYRIPAQDAEDLLQETFLIMVSKAGSIRNPDPWLVATLANRCIIYWRKHRSKLWDLVDSTLLELLADVEAPPQERADLRYDLESLLPSCRIAAGLCSGCATDSAAAPRKRPSGWATASPAFAR